MKLMQLKKVILLVGDVVLFYIALAVTLIIRYKGTISLELWLNHLTPFTLLFLVWLAVFFINNLYAVQFGRSDSRLYGYLFQNLIINTLIGFTFFYLSPASLTSLKPFRVLIVLVLLYGVLFICWRVLFNNLTKSSALANKILFIGINAEVIQLAEYIEKHPQLGYRASLIINFDQNQLPDTLQHIPHLRDLTDLISAIKNYKIQTIVTISSPQHSPIITRYLFETLSMKLNYFNLQTFYEKLTGKIPVTILEKSWFIENLLEGNKSFYELAKRLIDIVCSIFFGLIALPFIPFIIIMIKMTSPGSVLYTQTRTGKGGRTFVTLKFRTMVQNAEQGGPQWTTKSDSRVTKLGKFLRKTRLDEMPQFINIFLGDMSFVGPRPERPEFVSVLSKEIPYYRERLLVKPGLTGWAQINFKYGESVEDALTKLQYDLYYIKNRSLTLDFSIILKTINTVINASLGQ